MGNSSSSSGRAHQDESVDFGYLTPQGVYTGPRDWNQAVVTQLICARRLAPFYRPLEDYEEDWDDEQILAARKEPPDVEGAEGSPRPETVPATAPKPTTAKRPGTLKEPSKPEAAIYRGAVECPICFLYYPPNINHSRCCDQAICTECFVQIKRSEPTATHLVSEPAACPYCVQDNFGVVYTPPVWRAGIGSDGSLWSDSGKSSPHVDMSMPFPTHKRRQKSFGADSPEVVTTDQIRPDWEAKLAAVRAAVTRRANRRIIMRQVGDRLIPVGVTSGRVHPLSIEEVAAEAPDTGGSRRSRRRPPQQNQVFEQFMGSVGMGGQDLEEIMIMEAMRLSLLDQEEQQRKEAEEKKKREQASQQPPPTAGEPGPSNLEHHSSANGSSASTSPSIASPTPTSLSPALRLTEPTRRGNSLSLSRSRSPSPSITPSSSSFNSITESTSRWRRRASSPPPFSTLTAALSASSVASAVLGHTAAGAGEPLRGPSTPQTTPTITSPATSTNTNANHTSGDGEVPLITFDTPVIPSSSSTTNIEREPGPSSSYTLPKPTRFDSFTSSIFSTQTAQSGSSYNVLPSSPDSYFSREPLLASESSSATPVKSVAANAEEQGDYFGNATRLG